MNDTSKKPLSDKIIDLARKIKALQEQGEAGERNAATGRLEYLMEKYGFTIDDLDSEVEKCTEFTYKNGQDWLLAQIIIHVAGKTRKMFALKGSRRNLLLVDLTAAEEIEIRAKFDHYWRAFDRDLKTLRHAFIYKNELLPGDSEVVYTADAKEIEEIERVRNMMAGIDKAEYLRQLQGSESI